MRDTVSIQLYILLIHSAVLFADINDCSSEILFTLLIQYLISDYIDNNCVRYYIFRLLTNISKSIRGTFYVKARYRGREGRSPLIFTLDIR